MNKKTCTCVIPFYNEKERILSVLRIVTAIKHVDEIICVDDGSTDGTGNEIKKHFPRVKLLSLPKNRGKASAIKRCLPDVKGEYILLLDADLSNLKKMEIERAITGMMRNTQIDMIILRRRFDPWINKIVRGDLLMSGERILKKNDLTKICRGKISGYQIEAAINYYMMDKKKTVFWMWHSGTNISKTKKIGLTQGTIKELEFNKSVIAYGGLLKYLQNVSTFCFQSIE